MINAELLQFADFIRASTAHTRPRPLSDLALLGIGFPENMLMRPRPMSDLAVPGIGFLQSILGTHSGFRRMSKPWLLTFIMAHAMYTLVAHMQTQIAQTKHRQLAIHLMAGAIHSRLVRLPVVNL